MRDGTWQKRYRQCLRLDVSKRIQKKVSMTITQIILTTSVVSAYMWFRFSSISIFLYIYLLCISCDYYYITIYIYKYLPVRITKLNRHVRLGIFDHRSGNRIRIKIQSGFNRNFFGLCFIDLPIRVLYMRITQHTHSHSNAFINVLAADTGIGVQFFFFLQTTTMCSIYTIL